MCKCVRVVNSYIYACCLSFYCLFGLTENDGHENDGPSKLQGMQLQAMKMTDQVAGVKLQDVKMTDQVAGHENARHKNAGHENAGHENTAHENARHHELFQ